MPFEVCKEKDQVLSKSVIHQAVCRTALATRVFQRGLNYGQKLKFEGNISALTHVNISFVFIDVFFFKEI